jgi:hypothetical protein
MRAGVMFAWESFRVAYVGLRLCVRESGLRDGTGSGSDRVDGARSLPLPVLSRSFVPQRLDRIEA